MRPPGPSRHPAPPPCDGPAARFFHPRYARGLGDYTQFCGWNLARAHAKSGDAAEIAGYLGRSDAFDRAIVSFAGAYAGQNQRDHEAFTAAVGDGRITAAPGF